MAHVYWRVNIKTCVNGIFGALSVIHMAATSGGTDLLTGGSIVSSGNNGSVETNAIDGDINTYWGGPGALPAYWGYHFASAVDITEVRITSGPSVVNYHPTTFDLDYSDNGSSWTTIQSYTSATWVDSVQQTFTVNATVAATVSETGTAGESVNTFGNNFVNASSETGTAAELLNAINSTSATIVEGGSASDASLARSAFSGSTNETGNAAESLGFGAIVFSAANDDTGHASDLVDASGGITPASVAQSFAVIMA